MRDPRTLVEIEGEAWLINGKPTYAGRTFRGMKLDGLLLNSRMVQGVFDDENPATRPLWRYPDTGAWDPERNTAEFVRAMPEWRAHGLIAVTLNLQGGCPLGYYRPAIVKQLLSTRGITADEKEVWRGLPGPDSQPWSSSAFTPEGRLKAGYTSRLERILDAADVLGMVVILGLFYFGQDERLLDEAAVTRAVDEACGWVLDGGHRNVVIEVANECDVPRYEHSVLMPARIHELILRAQSHSADGRRLRVGTSYRGGSIPGDAVAAASDFLLLHGNGVSDPGRIAAMVDEARALKGYRPMPVLFNEDDHFDFDRPVNNFTAALSRRAGWGYFDPGEGAGGKPAFGDYREGYQNVPVNWAINTPRKQAFFQFLREMTGG